MSRAVTSVILDIDLDYFPLLAQPLDELAKVLRWAARPVDFIVTHHHEAYRRWIDLVKKGTIGVPRLILHLDEHHDMLSDVPPVQFGNFLYFALRRWANCRVQWVTPQPIDYPDRWLSAGAWRSVSKRFKCVSGLRRTWPRPDLVSVCVSPGFLEDRLCRELSVRVKKSSVILARTG
jgi:hypothetical protein